MKEKTTACSLLLMSRAIGYSNRNGLPDKVGKTIVSHFIRGDDTLRIAQEKVLRVAGPLMTLLKQLDDIRKREKKLKLEKVLKLVEKAVVLTGQANVEVQCA